MLLIEIRENNIYNETQFGLQKGRGTMDVVYNLKYAKQNCNDREEMRKKK